MEHDSPERVDITGLCGIKHGVVRTLCPLDQCGIRELHATTDARSQGRCPRQIIYKRETKVREASCPMVINQNIAL
jgi:hypothetical protein